jgi:hypothetical protein
MKTTIYTQSFGNVTVDLYENTYNGLTINQIKTRMQGWHDLDKRQYLKNCYEVIACQMSGCNLNTIESLKNSNFFIANNYINK